MLSMFHNKMLYDYNYNKIIVLRIVHNTRGAGNSMHPYGVSIHFDIQKLDHRGRHMMCFAYDSVS